MVYSSIHSDTSPCNLDQNVLFVMASYIFRIYLFNGIQSWVSFRTRISSHKKGKNVFVLLKYDIFKTLTMPYF